MLDKLKTIGQVLTNRYDPPTIQAPTKEKIFEVFGGLLDLQANNLSNEKTISKKLLKANTNWVYRNNDVIAKEVSKMEFELFSVGLKDGEVVFNEIESHPLLDLLDKPNSSTTKSDLLYITQSHKKLTGDAFWLKLMNGSTTVGFVPLQPDKIELKLGNPTDVSPDLVEGYLYKDVIDGKKVELTYTKDQIIHFKTPNPNNMFRGFGAVEAAADVIDLDNLTNQTTKSFFEKGAITNFVLSTDAKLSPEQIKRLNGELRQMYSGAQNAYKTMILGGNLKPIDVSYTNKDMQFLEQLTWYRDKIMMIFGNTKAAMGMIDDVNRASHESSMVEWKRTTVKPDMDAILSTLNEFLVPEFGKNLILGYTDPVPEDRTDDIDEATKLYEGGIIMRSEARELLDYEADTSDEVYLQPMGSTTTPDGLDPNGNDENVDQENENVKEDS